MELLLLPELFLEDRSQNLSLSDKGFVTRFIDKLAIRAVFVASYVELRGGSGCGDRGHYAAERVAEQRAEQVRKLLGYPE